MIDSLDAVKANLLFVDDENNVIQTLKRSMRNTDYRVYYVNSGAEALALMEEHVIDVVISDMKMPEMTGEELLREISIRYPETIRIVLSAFSEDDLVMKAINEGHIWGFIHKPWNGADLIQAIDQAVFTQQVVAERALLKRTLAQYKRQQKEQFQGFIGNSSEMQSVYSAIEKAAPSSASVMITGESGTGKEVTAQALHDLSNNSEGPFVAINCAAIPSELMESEIFGHIKGAFSGAVSNRDGAATLAHGGTLFLDELAEMDINLQSKLLRFIQTGTYQRVGASQTESAEIRFICATNQEPLDAIKAKNLREDLYYRLNVISVHLPPLRERTNDALILAESFLKKFTDREDKAIVGFSSDAEKLVLNYAWPGNVRQLENSIHSAVVMSSGPLITDQCIANALRIKLDNSELKAPAVQSLSSTSALPNAAATTVTNTTEAFTNNVTLLERKQAHEPGVNPINEAILPLAHLEQLAIKKAIDQCEGNVVRAAGLLQVSPSTLYRKIQSWESA